MPKFLQAIKENNTAQQKQGTRNTTGSSVQSQAQHQAQQSTPQSQSQTGQKSNVHPITGKNVSSNNTQSQNKQTLNTQPTRKTYQQNTQQTSKPYQSDVKATVQNAPTVQQQASQQTGETKKQTTQQRTPQQQVQNKAQTAYQRIVTALNAQDAVRKAPVTQQNAVDRSGQKVKQIAQYTVKGSDSKTNKSDEQKSFLRRVKEGINDIFSNAPKTQRTTGYQRTLGGRNIGDVVGDYVTQQRDNRALQFGMSDAEQEAIARARGASEEDIALAKQTYLANVDYINRNGQHGLTFDKMVQNQMRTAGGLPMDSWLRFLPDDDGNIIDRTMNSARAGILQHGQGFTGLQADIGNRLGANEYEQNRLKDYQYQQLLNQQALSGDNQGMYDRIVSNAVANTLTGLETMALGELGGLDVGTKALENLGLGNMGVNAFGNAYGQVRTGGKGDQYTNDVDAARRYAYGSALNELAQEKMFDALGLISGGKITENTIPGANVFGLGSFMTEAAEEGAGALADPLTEALLDGEFMSEEYRRRVAEIYGEQGVLGTLQLAGNAALEGGLGGVAGGVMSNPYQAVRQVGTDINALSADLGKEGIKNTLKAYDQAMQNGQETGEFAPNPNGYSLEGARAQKLNKGDATLSEGTNATDDFVFEMYRNEDGTFDVYDTKTGASNTYKTAPTIAQAEQDMRQATTDEKTSLDYEEYGEALDELKNNKNIEKNISTLKSLVSKGGLRSSIPSVRERAQRANEAILRYDVKTLGVQDAEFRNGVAIYKPISEKTIKEIVDISNRVGIPVDFLPYQIVERKGAGAWFAPGPGGKYSLNTGVIHLPNRPISEDTLIEALIHEITHTTEGSHSYEKFKENLRENANTFVDEDGNVTSNPVNSDAYAEDKRHMFGVETVANRSGDFGNKNPGTVESYASGRNKWTQSLLNPFDANGEVTNLQTRATKARTTGLGLEAQRAGRYVKNTDQLEYDADYVLHLKNALDEKVAKWKERFVKKNDRQPTRDEIDRYKSRARVEEFSGAEIEGFVNSSKYGLPVNRIIPYNGEREWDTPKVKKAKTEEGFTTEFKDYANGNIHKRGETDLSNSNRSDRLPPLIPDWDDVEGLKLQKLDSVEQKQKDLATAKSNLVDQFDRILGMLPGEDNVLTASETNRLATELILSEGKEMRLPDKLKHLEDVFFKGTNGRPAVAPQLYKYYKEQADKIEAKYGKTKKTDQQVFNEQVMEQKPAKTKKANGAKNTAEQNEEKASNYLESKDDKAYKKVDENALRAANDFEQKTKRSPKKYWEFDENGKLSAKDQNQLNAFMATIFGEKNSAQSFAKRLQNRFKLTEAEAKTAVDLMAEKGFNGEVLEELVNEKGIKKLATEDEGGELKFSPHKELGNLYNEYAPKGLGVKFRPYTSEMMDEYDEKLAKQKAFRGSKAEFEQNLNEDDRKLLDYFFKNASKFGKEDVDTSSSALGGKRTKEGQSYIIEPDGSFSGSTVNNLYQGLMDSLRDVLIGRTSKLGTAMEQIYGTYTNSYKDAVRGSDAKAAFEYAKKLYNAAQDLKENGVDSKYFKDSGYKVLDEKTASELNVARLKGETAKEQAERVSKIIDKNLDKAMTISNDSSLSYDEKLRRSLELFKSSESTNTKTETKTEEKKVEEVKKETPVEEKRVEERKEETPKEETAKAEAPVEPTQQAKSKEETISEETRQDLDTLAYFRNQEIENANLPSGMERVQRKSDEGTNPTKERVQTKSRISKADTEVASMDAHEMMKYFREEEWEGSDIYNKKTNEERDTIDNELDMLVDEVENPKDIAREEGKVHNTFAAILYRAGGKLEHVNKLAKTYEETGKFKGGGTRDVERDILDAHKKVGDGKFKDSASAEEFVRRIKTAWRNSTQASQEMSQADFANETGQATTPIKENTNWTVVDGTDTFEVSKEKETAPKKATAKAKKEESLHDITVGAARNYMNHSYDGVERFYRNAGMDADTAEKISNATIFKYVTVDDATIKKAAEQIAKAGSITVEDAETEIRHVIDSENFKAETDKYGEELAERIKKQSLEKHALTIGAAQKYSESFVDGVENYYRELGMGEKTASALANATIFKYVTANDTVIKRAARQIAKKTDLTASEAESELRHVIDSENFKTAVDKANKERSKRAQERTDNISKLYKDVSGTDFTAEQKKTITDANVRAEQIRQEKADRSQARAEEYVQKKAESQKAPTEEEIRKAGADRLKYAEDFSESQTSKRMSKENFYDEGLRARIDESHKIKGVKHDKEVMADAKKWRDESGLGGVTAYAEGKNLQNNPMNTEEEELYLIEGLKDLSKLSSDIRKNIERLEKSGETGSKEALSQLRDEQKNAADSAVTVFEAIWNGGSEAGRALRAMRYLYETPELIPTYMQRKVDQLNREYEKKLKGRKITLNQELMDKISDPNISDKERDELWEKVNYDIADQLPRTLKGRMTQWRKTGMLLNPRTHIRNYASNMLTYGMFGINDTIQAGVENAVLNSKALQKVLNVEYTEADRRSSAGRIGKEYHDVAKWLDEQHEFSKEAPGSGKFNIFEGISEAGAFSNNNAVGKTLNDISRWNNKWLEKEDRTFVQKRARQALAGMLKAQGYTVTKTETGYDITKGTGENAKKIDSKVLEAIEREALKNAQEATYHDFNQAAKAIENLKKSLGPAGYAIDIVVPFTKTPANIMRRSLEFSPAGLAWTLTHDLAKVRSGDMSASTYVTRLSRGLTGTVAFIAGAVLANMGVLSKPDDDDEEARSSYYRENIFGKQDLAVHVGDRYYSIEWAMPTAAPIMMGAAMADEFAKHGLNILDYDIKELLKDGASAINPVLEASYLGSLSDLINSYSQGNAYGGNIMPAGTLGGIDRAASSIIENLAGQMVPTVGGAINRTIDSTKRTTSGNTMGERMMNKALMNLPFHSNLLQPAIDEKGNEIENVGAVFGNNLLGRAIYNFVMPMTITEDKHDELDSALMDIGKDALPRNQTGSGGLKGQILADLDKAGLSLADISGEEYTEVKKTYYGNYRQYAKDYNELAEYNNLGTHTRDAVYKKIEQLALNEAKATYYDKVGDVNDLYTEEQKAALSLKKYGVSPAEFFLIKDCGLSGNRKALYVMSELERLGVADEVVDDILHQKYFPSAVGLTDSIVVKTPDEREAAREKYLVDDDYETLESKVAAYRAMSKEEYEAKKDKDAEESREDSWEDFFKKYDKKYGTNYSAAFANKDGKGGNSSKGSGKKGKSGGSKRSSKGSKTTKEKAPKQYTPRTYSRRGRSGGGGGGSSSVTPDDQALFDMFMRMASSGLSGRSKSTIKASVDMSNDAKLWDTIMNGSKKDVEKLRKELKL